MMYIYYFYTLGADCKILIWNIGTGEIVSQMDLPDQIFHCCFNWNGSRLVTTCKDKKIRVFDPRSGEMKFVSSLGLLLNALNLIFYFHL